MLLHISNVFIYTGGQHSSDRLNVKAAGLTRLQADSVDNGGPGPGQHFQQPLQIGEHHSYKHGVALRLNIIATNMVWHFACSLLSF